MLKSFVIFLVSVFLFSSCIEQKSGTSAALFASVDRDVSVSPTSTSMDIVNINVANVGHSYSFKVKNYGEQITPPLQIFLTNNENFELVEGQSCQNKILHIGASCTIKVQPVAYEEGHYSGELIVEGKGIARAKLSGIAYSGPVYDDLGVPFVTRWKTDLPGESFDNQIKLPLKDGYDYDFYVDWGDGSWDYINSWDDPSRVHTYDSAGTYTVVMTGSYEKFSFGAQGDAQKLLKILQWGDNEWASMNSSFEGCVNLTLSAQDYPDLSGVIDVSFMFSDASELNSDISGWNVSNVELVDGMFLGASSFNQSLNDWNVTNVISCEDFGLDPSLLPDFENCD